MSQEKEIALFLSVAIGIWTALNLYTVWRIASVPLVARHVPAGWLIAAGAFFWASFLLSIILGHLLGWNTLAQPFEFIGTAWLGIVFLLFSCFLVVDLISGFSFLLPRLAPLLRTAGLVAGIGLCLIAFAQGLRPPVVRDFEVRLAHLPPEADGLVLVEISDLHLGAILGERWLSARLAQLEALHPDLLVIVGDLIDGHGPPEWEKKTIPILRRLHAPLGVWAVTGNHEVYAGLDRSVRFFHEAGIPLLRDEWREVRPGLVLAGVDDPHDHRLYVTDLGQIKKALSGRPAGYATVFLSHRPVQAEAVAGAGVDLMLSGHTHGGQIWPFNYIVARFFPLLGGRYEVKGMPVIVCRGTGTWGPRMRLWRPGEIVRVTLRSPQMKDER